MIFLVIPMKVKWLAWIIAGFSAFSFIFGADYGRSYCHASAAA